MYQIMHPTDPFAPFLSSWTNFAQSPPTVCRLTCRTTTLFRFLHLVLLGNSHQHFGLGQRCLFILELVLSQNPSTGLRRFDCPPPLNAKV
jgi:hypothetical protein